MIISHKYKFIFIKTGKTGGTSIEVFLSKFCDENDILTPIYPPEKDHLPRNYTGYFNPFPEILYKKFTNISKTFEDLRTKRKFYNHIPAYLVKARVHKRIWRSYFKFCFERNPWDKTLSEFHWRNYKDNTKRTFDEYLKKGKFRINYPKYTDFGRRKIIVDYVGKYENLNEELKKICKSLEITFDASLLPNAKGNARKDRRPYQSIYSKKQRDIVEKVFATEINLHGYSFD